jgi:hypothetical protein
MSADPLWILAEEGKSGECWVEGVFSCPDTAKGYLERIGQECEWKQPEEGDHWFSGDTAGMFWRIDPYVVDHP